MNPTDPDAPAAAFQCFKALGFTDGCASIWLFNVLNTFQTEDCRQLCLAYLQSGDPPNGDPPECTIAPCLQCDEQYSGPTFLKYAGRTRRNSGLLSNVARPCSDLVRIDQRNPCNNGLAKGLSRRLTYYGTVKRTVAGHSPIGGRKGEKGKKNRNRERQRS